MSDSKIVLTLDSKTPAELVAKFFKSVEAARAVCFMCKSEFTYSAILNHQSPQDTSEGGNLCPLCYEYCKWKCAILLKRTDISAEDREKVLRAQLELNTVYEPIN